MIVLKDKYEFYINEQGVLQCTRYGLPWREFLGDKAVHALYDFAIQMQADSLTLGALRKLAVTDNAAALKLLREKPDATT